jgi:uncharacterized phiE125 gp8 family phage protein
MPGCNLITPASIAALAQDLLADQLKIDDSALLALADAHLVGAISDFESRTGRALLTSDWLLTLDAWPAGSEIVLPKGHLRSVAAVKYRPVGAAEQTFDAANYVVDIAGVRGRIVLTSGASWPGDELVAAAGVTVQFSAGWSQDELPADIRQALLLRVQSVFDASATQADVNAARRIDDYWRSVVLRYQLA